MVADKDIKAWFQGTPEGTEMPRSLDVKVRKRAESHFQQLYGSAKAPTGFQRKLMLRLLPVVLAVVLACGFGYAAVQRLYTAESHDVRLEGYIDSSMILTRITGAEIRNAMEEVEARLQTGEKALIYFPELAKEENPYIRQNPIIGVSKPAKMNSLEQWNNIAREKASLDFPASIGSYQFIEGKEELPTGTFLPLEAYAMKDELERQAQEGGAAYAWKQVDPKLGIPMPAYSAKYKEPSTGRDLFVSYQTMLSGKIKLTHTVGAGSESRKLAVQGEDAYYSGGLSFYTPTDYYQDIFWITEKNGTRMMVRVGTASQDVTPEQLAELAGMIED